MTVSSDVIQAAVEAALKADGATGAGANVFSPRSWPTRWDGMPIILVSSPREVKRGLGRSGAAQFNCLLTLRVVARVAAKAGLPPDELDKASAAALAAVGVLQRQIEVSVIDNAAIRRAGVQQFSTVEVSNDVKSEGEFTFGEVVMDFGLEFYQGPGDFHPVDLSPIDALAVFADLLNIFSPLGDFEGQADATPWAADATPVPREAGPDGRAEAALAFDFTVAPYALDFSVVNNSMYAPLV